MSSLYARAFQADSALSQLSGDPAVPVRAMVPPPTTVIEECNGGAVTAAVCESQSGGGGMGGSGQDGAHVSSHVPAAAQMAATLALVPTVAHAVTALVMPPVEEFEQRAQVQHSQRRSARILQQGQIHQTSTGVGAGAGVSARPRVDSTKSWHELLTGASSGIVVGDKMGYKWMGYVAMLKSELNIADLNVTFGPDCCPAVVSVSAFSTTSLRPLFLVLICRL